MTEQNGTREISIENELSGIRERIQSNEFKTLAEVEKYCLDKGLSDEETNSILGTLQEEQNEKSEPRKEKKKHEADKRSAPEPQTSPTVQPNQDGKQFIQSSIDNIHRNAKSELFALVSGIMDAPNRNLQVRSSGVMNAILDKAAEGLEDSGKIVSDLSEAVAKIAHTERFTQYSGQVDSIYKTVGTSVETKLSQLAQATDDLFQSLGL